MPGAKSKTQIFHRTGWMPIYITAWDGLELSGALLPKIGFSYSVYARHPKEGCAGPVKRLIGLGSGLIFKGSGFYITDYRSDSYKAAKKQDSDSGSSSASTPAPAKPAAPPAP